MSVDDKIRFSPFEDNGKNIFKKFMKSFYIFIGVKIFECTVLIKNERVKGTVDFKFAL